MSASGWKASDEIERIMEQLATLMKKQNRAGDVPIMLSNAYTILGCALNIQRQHEGRKPKHGGLTTSDKFIAEGQRKVK